MAHFRGVATRYLASYLGWRRPIERMDSAINPAAILMQCREIIPTPNANRAFRKVGLADVTD